MTDPLDLLLRIAGLVTLAWVVWAGRDVILTSIVRGWFGRRYYWSRGRMRKRWRE